MISLLGAVLLQGGGAALRRLLMRTPLRVGLASPASLFVSLALLYAAALGWVGLGVLAVAAVAAWRSAPSQVQLRRQALPFLLALAAVVLLRPWTPTMWDEFIWLGKARFGGFATLLPASLDAAQQLIPAGYPPLWPLSVHWISLGVDALDAQVLAATLLVLFCFAAALEAWSHRLRGATSGAVLLCFTAPLVLVHARSVYVDLPLGLLGLALLGQLLQAGDRPGFPAVAIAACLCGFKDEGLVHVLAASTATLLVSRPRQWSRLLPALVALVTAGCWRLLLVLHEVPIFDHGLHVPAAGWAPELCSLVLRHAGDFPSWGLFWAAVLAAVTVRSADVELRALKWTLAVALLLLCLAVLSGPERVRVFAENGTLFNRLLMQLWPPALLVVWLTWQARPSAAQLTDRAA